MSSMPHIVDHLIDLVRKLDAVQQERALAVTSYDARIATLKAEIASAMGSDSAPSSPPTHAGSPPSATGLVDTRPPLRPASNAARVYSMIADKTFTVGAAAKSLYEADPNDSTARKNVRSVVKYLIKSGWVRRDEDELEVVKPYKLTPEGAEADAM